MRFVLALTAALVPAPAFAQQADVPPAVKNAETCLRQNAAAAAQASSGASDAADFLLTYLCAGQVEAAARHGRSTQTLAMMREMGLSEMTEDEEDWLAGAMVNPSTGELELKAAKSAEAQGMVAGMQMMSGFFGGGQNADPRPIALRELAGRLIMEERARR